MSALHHYRGVASAAGAPKKSRSNPQSYGHAGDGEDAEDSLLPEPEGDGEVLGGQVPSEQNVEGTLTSSLISKS